MFKKALPVFPAGHENEMNVLAGFYAEVGCCADAILRITGCTQYKIFIDGKLIHHGPARTCHGKFKVDELKIGKYLTEKRNFIVIHLLSSLCLNYASAFAPAFLQAEIENCGEITAFTGKNGGFKCVILEERLQKVLRYSFQRPFTDAFYLNQINSKFNTDPENSGHDEVEVALLEEKSLLPRDLYYPEYPIVKGEKIIKKGVITAGKFDEELLRWQSPRWDFNAYPLEELQCNVLEEYFSKNYEITEKCSLPAENFAVESGKFAIIDMSKELTGFINLEVEAMENCEIYVSFDEVMNGETVDPLRLTANNIVKIQLEKGEYSVQTEEPYSLRYMQISAVGGKIKVKSAGICRVGYGEIAQKFNSEDEAEQKIYAAAIETFRQNTYDIFMDCPSRERAGWLCDSFFTGRSELAFTGKNEVERAFLMNFIHKDGDFPYLPHGMLPMCYPADQANTDYIPNWAMFFVVELEDYLKRTGDRALIDAAKERALNLCEFFTKYENSDGLLEKLDKWIMVEWSKAGDFVQDINFPTNALYSKMLESAGKLYGKPELLEKAEKIRTYIRENAMVDGFFCDNMVRNEAGELVLSGECTEVCQYYMFFFGVANPQTHGKLWKILCEEFSPNREKEGKYPKIYPANAFIGNYLRLEILYQNGLYDQVMEEIRGYFLYMAEKTGTLWEHVGDTASCNHGFASYVAVLMLNIRNK